MDKLGVVTRNKAKAELEIHLAEDPLPLRRAKINTEVGYSTIQIHLNYNVSGCRA